MQVCLVCVFKIRVSARNWSFITSRLAQSAPSELLPQLQRFYFVCLPQPIWLSAVVKLRNILTICSVVHLLSLPGI